MTVPLPAAAPSGSRPSAPPTDSRSTDSAAPFASALDGALTAGRTDVDSAGAETGGGTEDEEAAAETTGETPQETTGAPQGGVVAALWALLTGAAKAQAATADGTTEATAVPVAPDQGPPPGLAVARGLALAHGVHGTQPGAAADVPTGPGAGLQAPAASATGLPTGTAAPVLPPPLAVPGQDAAALAAAGLEVVSVTTSGPATPGTAVAAAATGVPGAVLATAQALAAGPPAADAEPAAGDAPTGTPAPTSAGGPAVAPAATGSGGGTGPGTGGDDSQRGGEPPAGRVEAGATAAAPAGPAPVITPARTEAATGAAVAQPVGGQIARSVAVLRGGPDGTHSMTVVLAPESLGRVEVSVTLSQGTVELTLRGAHEHGRAALLEALPDLRRDLESAGLTCGRLDVDRGTRDGAGGGQQQGAGRPGDPGTGERGAQHERPDGGARPWHRSADTAGEPRPAGLRSDRGLDVRV